MKWFSTRDKLPTDQQEVLIKCKGNIHLAKYHKEKDAFQLRNNDLMHVNSEPIEWMELVSPFKS